MWRDKLHTDLYRKPTDRNTILRGDSFHPRPLIKSLPISHLSVYVEFVAQLNLTLNNPLI